MAVRSLFVGAKTGIIGVTVTSNLKRGDKVIISCGGSPFDGRVATILHESINDRGVWFVEIEGRATHFIYIHWSFLSLHKQQKNVVLIEDL